MAKTRNNARLDTSGFETYIRDLARLGADVQGYVTTVLSQAAEKVDNDTRAALPPQFMPAGGKYSHGKTKESIVTDTTVTWSGGVGSVPIGFDFSKPGAGGYLITGTPKMRPNPELNKIYKQKKYMNAIQKEMGEKFLDFIADEMGK